MVQLSDDTSGSDIGLLQLVTPIVPAALELLSDENGYYTVHIVEQSKALVVIVPAPWPEYEMDYRKDRFIRFELLWKPITGFAFRPVQIGPDVQMPENPGDLFPVTGAVPESYLRSGGIFELRYRVRFLDNDQTDDSPSFWINLDKTAPNNNIAALQPVLNEVGSLIDQGYLDRNGDQVMVTIGAWPDIRLGDVVELFLEPTLGAIFDSVSRLTITPALKGPARIPITISGDAVRRKGNGLRYLYFRLVDRAGNVGPISIENLLQVSVPEPIRLPPPSVSWAEDGLIDLEDVRRGVEVLIPRINEAVPGDVLQAYWNNRALAQYRVPESPVWPVSVTVPWAILSADGFAGRVPARVHYLGSRDAGTPLVSPPFVFEVDLSTAGPGPIGPDPINPRLIPVVVRGSTGDNVLLPADRGRPVTVQVQLYEAPVAGEVLELCWGSNPGVVATYTISASDRVGQWVTFTPVPYSVVQEAGDGLKIPVYYWTFNGVNRQRARDTQVHVATQPVTGFYPASFPGASLWGWVNCASTPWKGVDIHIPGDRERLAENDIVEASWQLFRDTVGEGAALTAKVYLAPYTLTARDAISGFNLQLPAVRFRELLLDPLVRQHGQDKLGVEGSAVVDYRVTKLNGRSGVSPVVTVSISLQKPGGGVCSGT